MKNMEAAIAASTTQAMVADAVRRCYKLFEISPARNHDMNQHSLLWSRSGRNMDT